MMKPNDERGLGSDNFGPPFPPTAQLVVENPPSDALRLPGEHDGQPIRVTLHQVKPNFVLQSRGLQRINESAILGTLSL